MPPGEDVCLYSVSLGVISYMMQKLSLLLCGLLASFFFSSCQTTPSGPGSAPRRPTVLLPYELDEREASYMRQITGMLNQYGYNPVRGGYADYELDFSIETGPINADANLTLREGHRTVAQGFGRDGGPRIILNRNQVVRNAVERCLAEFEPQLRSARRSYGGQRGDYYNRYGSGYDDTGYDRQRW
jgi:hypothetical protein